jgi:hypothetical protein
MEKAVTFEACSTHDFHPFSCLSRLLKYLGGHLKSLKLFKTQHNVALKRLASAVQLRPWPPYFQSLILVSSTTTSRRESHYLGLRRI